MLNSKKQPFFNLQWSGKNSKSFCYDFYLGQLMGLNISSEYENYLSWKKLLYSQVNPSLNLKCHSNDNESSFQHFIENIKLIAPRPLDKHIENHPIQEIYKYIRALNQVKQNIDHNILQTCEKMSWKSLPTHKKILLQVINSIDLEKKMNFVFLERLNLPDKDATFFVEVLKNICHKNNLSIIVFAQSRSLAGINWLPLFSAPIEKLSLHENFDEEDADEAAS